MGASGNNQYGPHRKAALCWDCAKACGGCSWSERLEPVKGCVAEPSQITIQGKDKADTLLILECPEFERDSWDKGMMRKEPKRLQKKEVTPEEIKGSQYKAVIYEDRRQVASMRGTIMEVAKWADTNIQNRGACSVSIKRISA